MLVHEYMSTPVITINPDMSYHVALKLLQERRLHHLPVADKDGRLVGMIAERDLLLGISHNVSGTVDISDIMQNEVVTADPEMLLSTAAGIMLENHFGSLPVIDDERKVIGIVTQSDVFRAFILLSGPRD
jgi:acetoin utilization protein AcuB